MAFAKERDAFPCHSTFFLFHYPQLLLFIHPSINSVLNHFTTLQATLFATMHSSDMAKGNDGFVEATKFGTENSSSDIPMQGVHGDVEIVADKWQGNASDRHDMLVLGRSQVLRVRALKLAPAHRYIYMG